MRSAINPVATAFELVHYLNIAEPKVLVADAAELKKVEKALESSDLKNRPNVVVIAKGTDSYDGNDVPVVRKPESLAEHMLRTPSFQETSGRRALKSLNHSICRIKTTGKSWQGCASPRERLENRKECF